MFRLFIIVLIFSFIGCSPGVQVIPAAPALSSTLSRPIHHTEDIGYTVDVILRDGDLIIRKTNHNNVWTDITAEQILKDHYCQGSTTPIKKAK